MKSLSNAYILAFTIPSIPLNNTFSWVPNSGFGVSFLPFIDSVYFLASVSTPSSYQFFEVIIWVLLNSAHHKHHWHQGFSTVCYTPGRDHETFEMRQVSLVLIYIWSDIKSLNVIPFNINKESSCSFQRWWLIPYHQLHWNVSQMSWMKIKEDLLWHSICLHVL